MSAGRAAGTIDVRQRGRAPARRLAVIIGVPVVIAAVAAVAVVKFGPALSLPGGPSSTDGGPLAGRVFYLDPAGDDAADGRSPTGAWRTLARASQQKLEPDDQVLLRGGARFTGTLRLEAGDSGRPGHPVVVGSFGTGRAVIAGSGKAAVDLAGAGNVRIRDLVLAGDPAAYESASGIAAYPERTERAEHLVIDHVDVSGFRIGIAIGADAPGGGWRDVEVSDARLHANRDAGLLTYGPTFDAADPRYTVADVRILRVVAFDNAGNPADTSHNSGSGIVLGSVDGGLVEHSTAYRNGRSCAAQEGPVGIWAYDSARVTIRRNLSWGNQTGGSADGGGFDLDQNVRDSVLEQNISHDNAGPGYMLFSTRDNDAQTNNVVRFNVSVDDAPVPGFYAGIAVIGRVSQARIYQNTVLSAGPGPAARVAGPARAVSITNNLFLSRGSGPLVELTADAGVSGTASGGAAPDVTQAGNATQNQVGSGGAEILAGSPDVTASEGWSAEVVAGLQLRADSRWAGSGVGLPAGEWTPDLRDLRGTPVRKTGPDPGALQIS